MSEPSVKASLAATITREDGSTVEVIPITPAMLEAVQQYLEAASEFIPGAQPWSDLELPVLALGWAVLAAIGVNKPTADDGPSVGGAPQPPSRRRPISLMRRVAIVVRDGAKCVQCQATDDLSIDHIVPISKGGSDEDANLQTLCRRCNSAKRDRLDPA